MLTLDGTANKANLGANAILGVSMAVIRAAAARTKSPLWSYISKNEENSLPVPLMNISERRGPRGFKCGCTRIYGGATRI